MEEAWEASSEEKNIIYDDLEEGALLMIVKGDEYMEKGMKNVPCMKSMLWRGRMCEWVNHVWKIIAEGRIIACDPKEHVLDDNLGETEVGVTNFELSKG